MEVTPTTAATATATTKTAEDTAPMPMEQMEVLVTKIGQLDPKYLPQLLDIASCQTQDGELELDLSKLKPEILRKMDRFLATLPPVAFLVVDPVDDGEPTAKRSKP